MINGYTVGTAEVKAMLDGKGLKFDQELRRGIGRLAIKVNIITQRDKLSGQVLGVRTGRLRRSIHDVVIDEGDKVVGIVSTNVTYGIGWETGWLNYQARAPKAGLDAAKRKFKPGGTADTFKNGTPRKRSFLATALRQLEESGGVRDELEAISKRATE